VLQVLRKSRLPFAAQRELEHETSGNTGVCSTSLVQTMSSANHVTSGLPTILKRMETSNMKPSEPSRTALMIARQRAAHQLLDHGSILDDPFAMKILREDEKDVLQFANAHPLASIGRLFTAARSRIAEDALSAAVERGVRQIVILGAGLDTFALRNPHGALEIPIYEVDHPATLAWKRQRLAEAQLAIPPWLILVPVDFERDDLGETLVGAGFQQKSPAFFTWLGVVPCLTQHAVGCSLDYMASIRDSEVVFDYMEPPQAFSEEMRELVTKRTEQLERIEERWASRFEPAGIAAILRSRGFCDIEDINFQEITSRFGRSIQRLAPGQAGLHVVHAKH
jgi:methyltransferase (TIGR00027 family)